MATRIQTITMKELIMCPMCSYGLFITLSTAFDEQRHVRQLSVCVYVCVCVSGSVVSSDKRPAGSTSLQEEGKPQQWGTGGREAGETAVGGGRSAGRFMRRHEGGFGEADPDLVKSPGLVSSGCRYVIMRPGAACVNPCKSTPSLRETS